MWLTNPLLVLICPCILPTSWWGATAQCDDPSPAFLLPNLNAASSEREAVQGIIENALHNISAESEYDRTSFSVEVTSNTETLFSFHHTAAQLDTGTDNVNGSSLYRIASITKSFTVLALIQQYAAGNLSLDDPVNKYISALNEPQNSTVRWKDITLRALASQIGGLSRDSESPALQCRCGVDMTKSCSARSRRRAGPSGIVWLASCHHGRLANL